MTYKSGNPIVAIVMALLVGGVIVLLLEFLSSQMVALPPGVDPTNPVHIREALEAGQIPMLGMALVLGGWLLGAYSGGRVALRIGKRQEVVVIYAAIFTGFVLWYLYNVPSPLWMWIGGAFAVPLVAIGAAGTHIVIRY
jgi:hypothetical protein